ncbi:MAG: DUF4262 domain-containing protein [Oxalobacteraceae bacterium]|nr:MAG: DUF4262 domain-containing protein [Oxalobacteraceae bacterium]
MRTALDAPDDALDDQERTFVANVRKHGWFRTSVFAEDESPGFAYTTGFCVNAQRPELLISSMNDGIAHDIFWDLFRDAKSGVSLPVGQPLDNVFGNGLAFVFPVAKRFYRDHLGWSRWFYGGDDFQCLQIVWPDRDQLFPWQPGFDEAFAGLQPDLSEDGWQATLVK